MTKNFFSMSDSDYKGKESQKKKQQREQEKDQKKSFIDKARQFMDDSPLGEPKGLLDKLMKRPGQEEPEPGAEETDFEYEDREEPFYDYADPESIQVGYIKPGTVSAHKRKSIGELQEERFDLKMDALSGLLSRFGGEAEDPLQRQKSVSKGIDKPTLRHMMAEISRQLAAQVQEEQLDWLQPDLIYLLARHNDPWQVCQFVIATLYAQMEESYLTESDRQFLQFLLRYTGSELTPEQLEEEIGPLFMFPERLQQLYQNLLTQPLQLPAGDFITFKRLLTRSRFTQLAEEYGVQEQALDGLLAERLAGLRQQLADDLAKLQQEQKQYQLMQERGVKSATLFAKLLKAETEALKAFQTLQALLTVIQEARQLLVLLLPAEDRAGFHLFAVEPPAGQPDRSPAWQVLLTKVLATVIPDGQTLTPLSQGNEDVNKETSDLSPVNQKKIITMAKSGDYPSLKVINTYKSTKISNISKLIRFSHI